MNSQARTFLKRVIKKPFNAIGFDIVRNGSETVSKARFMPSWSERMSHARKLGFSPKVIFDGGGFTGQWTMTAADLFPGTQIVIIEPNPFVQDDLKDNLSHIQPQPKIINVALSESPGTAKLNIWREEKLDTGASLLSHVSGKAREAVEVNIDTLDNISQQTGLNPDLVKLDLQGGELLALKGASQILKQAEFMILEFSCLEAYIGRSTPRDLLEIMFENEYSLYDIVDCSYRPYDGALTGGDFFFVKNNSVLRNYKGWE
jgi:FkbM family methyltransferase